MSIPELTNKAIIEKLEDAQDKMVQRGDEYGDTWMRSARIFRLLRTGDAMLDTRLAMMATKLARIVESGGRHYDSALDLINYTGALAVAIGQRNSVQNDGEYLDVYSDLGQESEHAESTEYQPLHQEFVDYLNKVEGTPWYGDVIEKGVRDVYRAEGKHNWEVRFMNNRLVSVVAGSVPDAIEKAVEIIKLEDKQKGNGFVQPPFVNWLRNYKQQALVGKHGEED